MFPNKRDIVRQEIANGEQLESYTGKLGNQSLIPHTRIYIQPPHKTRCKTKNGRSYNFLCLEQQI